MFDVLDLVLPSPLLVHPPIVIQTRSKPMGAGRGAVLSYTDPFVKELRLGENTLRHEPLTVAAARADC